MKKIKYLFFAFSLAIMFVACDDEGEVFTGSPVDNANIQIVTLNSTISTDIEAALTDQKVPFTITLPRTFADTVQVEVTALTDGGTRRREYIEVLPNQNNVPGEILAPGGAIFNSTFSLQMTAIELYSVEPGIHYLMSSNVLSIPTGNTSIPTDDETRLQIKLAWPNGSSTTNDLKFVIDRPEGVNDANIIGFTGGTYKVHYIRNTGTGNSVNSSTNQGDYILQIGATRLVSSPVNMPYRFVINYPDTRVEVYQGVYENLTVDSPLKPILKINKTVNGDGSVTYTTTEL